MRVHYFDIPLKDLYNTNYYSNLQSFKFEDFFGVQFVQTKNEQYLSSFLLFSYGNSSDPKPINHIFDEYDNNNKKYILHVSDYINLQNNMLCYELKGIKIISKPPSSTNIKVIKSNLQEVNIGEEISLNENISITYTSNLEDVMKGNYILSFTLTYKEPNDFFQCQITYDYFGIKMDDVGWISEEFEGRITKLKFTVGNCYKNCGTCIEEGTSLNDQKCETCFDGYFFEENTKNCYKYPNEGYYFNKNKQMFSPCHRNCKSCATINTVEDEQKCFDCKANFLFYNNSNCLSCKYLNLYTNYEKTSCIQSIPEGFYLNDHNYNTIEKCNSNCLSCTEGSTDDNNMKCKYCDNQNGLYFLENTKNCYRFPYAQHYLGEDFIIKKCYYACKTCSSGPVYNSRDEVTNMNCATCNNELGFFKSDSNPTNCEFKEKNGEYYDESTKTYKPCYSSCLTCFNKETNSGGNLIMNCLTCDEKNGFHLFTKSGNNCLNCKSQNKYVNYEQNKCIDEIPQGYYLKNELYNQIDICYSKCKTCSEKGTSDNNMKCDSCDSNYILYNKNCVQDMACPRYFYNKANAFDDMVNLNEKICLNDKSNSPDTLPFYYTHTYECVDICPFDFLISQGCKVGNILKGLNKLIKLYEIEYSKGKLANFYKIFAFSEKYRNYIIKINLVPFNSANFHIGLSEEINKIPNIDSDSSFGLINKNYFEEVDLKLDKCIEILKENDIITDASNITMLKVDLKVANSTENNFYFKLFNDADRQKSINLSLCYSQKIIININITQFLLRDNNTNTNFSKAFFNDQCYIFYSEDGTDVLTDDRKIDYNNYTLFDKDSDTNQTSESENITDSIIEANINKYCPSDCEFIEVNFTTKIVSCSCPFNRQNNENYEINIELPVVQQTNKLENKKKNKRNLKSMSYSSSNIYVLKCINDISKYMSKNYILIIFNFIFLGYVACVVIYFIIYRKQYIVTAKKTSKIHKKVFLANSIISNPPRNNQNSSNISKSLKMMDSNNNIKSNYHFQQQQQINNNIKDKDNNNNNKSITLPSDNSFNFIDFSDLDLIDYNLVVEKDKRTFWETFLSFSKKRQIFIFCFINDHNIKVLKISLLLLSLINYFMINLFFFNDKVIHKIYTDKGKYNFGYQLKYICLSALISCLFLYISKYIFTFHPYSPQLIQIIKCIDFSLIIIVLLFIFYWIYIGSFCSVFIKTQKHLMINFIITFIVSAIYELIITLIAYLLRRVAIDKKNLPKLYLISTLLVSLKN